MRVSPRSSSPRSVATERSRVPTSTGSPRVVGATTVPVIASGGVGRVDHLRTLADLRRDGRGLGGAIVGRALYEGTVDLGEALAVLAS